MKALFRASFAALFLIASAGVVQAAGPTAELHEPEQGWPHQGPFGKFDRAAAQRGFQVYKEVCASCHGLRFVSFRTLSGIGFSEPEIKAIAADFYVEGEPDDFGEVEERPGKPFDYFPDPYPNDKAAAAANGGAVPPDMSLMAKKRAGGETYIYNLLTGYEEPTEEDLKDVPGGSIPIGSYYNPYMSGKVIAMAPPLSEGIVEYAEGQPEATVDQMAYDVATFLTWTAEPKMEERKSMGFEVMIFTGILAVLFFLSYRRIARRVLGH